MKLDEIHGRYRSGKYHTLKHDGFILKQEEEDDGDVVKIFHWITPPGKEAEVVNHNPYEDMSMEAFKVYIEYYKEHGKFPRSPDIGPFNNESILKFNK